MKIERLKKAELVDYCKSIGIDTHKKTKNVLMEEAHEYRTIKIKEAIKNDKGEQLLTEEIKSLAETYSENLKMKIDERKGEMKEDDTSHYLIYRVLGISSKDGQLIDEYQNTGRFLYKYAGSFLEEAASLCLEFNNPEGQKTTVENNQGQKPLKSISSMITMQLKSNGETRQLMEIILPRNIQE